MGSARMLPRYSYGIKCEAGTRQRVSAISLAPPDPRIPVTITATASLPRLKLRRAVKIGKEGAVDAAVNTQIPRRGPCPCLSMPSSARYSIHDDAHLPRTYTDFTHNPEVFRRLTIPPRPAYLVPKRLPARHRTAQKSLPHLQMQIAPKWDAGLLPLFSSSSETCMWPAVLGPNPGVLQPVTRPPTMAKSTSY